MLDHATIEEFAGTLRGRLIRPEDSDYDETRKVYNAMIDKRPRLIARCADVSDVIAAVNFGRENGLDTAIRGGGHSGPGLGLVDDGLVIDLSGMKGIRVDPQTRTVRVEPGCVWGDVDHATGAFGLATVSGIVSTTGVGGLTLGGGHGYLTRKYGLTIDNLTSADVVLADGRFVHTNEYEHSDLFWALRGGGGNFGVVTSFEFRLHPVGEVLAGPFFWSLDHFEAILRWYRDWLPEARANVYAFFLIGEIPPDEAIPQALHGRKVCGLQWCFLGSDEEAEAAQQAARDVAEPLFEGVMRMPYPTLQRSLEGLYPPGNQWYWKGDFIRDISDEAIAVHRRFAEVPTALSAMHLYPIDAAVHCVDKDETAWGHRYARWSMVIAGVDTPEGEPITIIEWARNYWQAVHPYTLGGAYVNFLMEEGQERIEATYGGIYERLSKVKAKYDPDNFFHVNQNIEPAGLEVEMKTQKTSATSS